MKATPHEIALLEAASAHRSDVLHLVGRVTDTVFSFLGPATAALAERGFIQTVVLIDDPAYRHVLEKFDRSVHLVLIDAAGSYFERVKRLLDAYCQMARTGRPAVAHLHGVVCSMIGLYAGQIRHLRLPTYFTPHGSRSLGPLRWLGATLRWALQPLSRRMASRVIANARVDARSVQKFTRESVDLIESPVAPVFFNERRLPTNAPLIVTGNRLANPLSGSLLAQCAVLLADQVPGLCFSCIGTADAESTAQINAAHVALNPFGDDAARAQHMATAWVFIAPDGDLGFPVYMAEAMALGLPCVAWETAYHRDLIRHGETGFICSNMDEMIDYLAQLIASAELRQRLGNAARAEAYQRFDGSRFRKALLRVYDAPLNRPLS